MSPARRVATIGICAALALAAGFMERFIPFPAAIPGARLGLANVVVLFALYRLGWREALGVSMVRVFAAGAAYMGLFGMLYSLAGALLSFLAMALAKRTKLFSPAGVSVLGGVTHNWGQLIIAAFLVENIGLLYYTPLLTLAGLAAGFTTGIIASVVLQAMERNGHGGRA